MQPVGEGEGAMGSVGGGDRWRATIRLLVFWGE